MTAIPGRFIAILEPGRCGSSALAGALHYAGVSMGRDLIGPHPQHNPMGHFEDREVHWQNRVIAHAFEDCPDIRNETVGRYPELMEVPRQVSDIMDERYAPLPIDMYHNMLTFLASPPLWGMKCLMLGVIWPHVQDLLPADRRIILLERSRDAIIQSRMQHSSLTWPQAEELVDYLAHAALSTAVTADCPQLTVRYERLVANPEAEIVRVLEFVSEGLDGVTLDTDAAINHIRPELNHHARNLSTEHV